MKIREIFLIIFFVSLLSATNAATNARVRKSITKAALRDKVKGAWAGQTIGVCFGSYTEFRYKGTYIRDYEKIAWYDGYAAELMDNNPGLFDDIYMDITFVDVLERDGFDAPTENFAQAFANAEYPLWHANQAARYNILSGVKQSGHWLNNPHADDIDYQIESDFAGIMNPGMPNSASAISDRVGHIMCYGDGWYGGVFMGAMYSLAYVSDDINYIVNRALKTIPSQSTFYHCISDVLRWHKKYPDWKRTWFELETKYADEKGCPDGVHMSFDIDAKLNAAYVVMGLLYGMGDFTRTMEISTRAGQDSDCNPSSAGGILGTMLGYENIPQLWKDGLKGAENKKFRYTNRCLDDLYEISYRHALAMIQKNGGTIDGDNITLPVQKPSPVRLEQCFDGLRLVGKITFDKTFPCTGTFEFDGSGFVLCGGAYKVDATKPDDVITAKFYIDNKFAEEVTFTTNSHDRRLELFWNYQLLEGHHTVTVTSDPQQTNAALRSWDCIIYTKEK